MNDPMSRQAFQLDVVAEAPGEQGGGVPRLLAIGEARSGERPRTMSDLARLERLRGLLSTRADASGARLAASAARRATRDVRGGGLRR